MAHRVMTAKKPGRGVDRKGRSKKGGKFVRLGNSLLTSEAWRSLSGSAVKYYIELRPGPACDRPE